MEINCTNTNELIYFPYHITPHGIFITLEAQIMPLVISPWSLLIPPGSACRVLKKSFTLSTILLEALLIQDLNLSPHVGTDVIVIFERSFFLVQIP